jgi:hypothetical protein
LNLEQKAKTQNFLEKEDALFVIYISNSFLRKKKLTRVIIFVESEIIIDFYNLNWEEKYQKF